MEMPEENRKALAKKGKVVLTLREADQLLTQLLLLRATSSGSSANVFADMAEALQKKLDKTYENRGDQLQLTYEIYYPTKSNFVWDDHLLARAQAISKEANPKTKWDSLVPKEQQFYYAQAIKEAKNV